MTISQQLGSMSVKQEGKKNEAAAGNPGIEILEKDRT